MKTSERKLRNQAAYRLRHPDRVRAQQRSYYERNKEEYAAKLRARREERYAILNAVKLERGCIRCGFREHPAALDFHHRDPAQKELEMAYAVDYTLERMTAEIEKCDVICANCHRALHVSGTGNAGRATGEAVSTLTTGTNSRTYYFSQGEWEGRSVLVQELLYDEQGPCVGHALEPMTHYDRVVEGELWCPHCCGVAMVPEA